MAISSGARGTAGQQQDRRNAADRARSGGAMGSGDRGTKSQQQDRRNAADRGRAATGDRGTAGQQQDKRNVENARATGLDAPGVGKAVDAYVDRVRDYEDEGNTTTENVGNVLAGLAGFNELDPEYDPENLNPDADWGFDVLGGLAGIAGMAVGAPGLGTVVGGIEDLLGIRDDLSLNLGPNALEDDPEPLVGAGTDMLVGGGSAGEDVGDPDPTGDPDPIGEDHGADRELAPAAAKKPPKRTPKPKPPKPWSTVGLGDVVSVPDWLGL